MLELDAVTKKTAGFPFFYPLRLSRRSLTTLNENRRKTQQPRGFSWLTVGCWEYSTDWLEESSNSNFLTVKYIRARIYLVMFVVSLVISLSHFGRAAHHRITRCAPLLLLGSTMGAGMSGDQLAVAVISHVIQSSGPELIAMRKNMSDAAKVNNNPKFVTRKQFLAAEVAVTVDESDREIFDRIFTLFDKTGAGTVQWREFLAGLAPLTKGTTAERLLLAFELFDTTNSGALDMLE